MKDDFYGKKQPFRSPWWLIGAAVLLIAVAAALLWPSESLAPAQEEQTQSAAADQAARLEDGAELFQRFTYTRCDHVVTRRVTAPVELYGKTLEEAQPLYPEWRITEFSPKALRMERQVPLSAEKTWGGGSGSKVRVSYQLYRCPCHLGSISSVEMVSLIRRAASAAGSRRSFSAASREIRYSPILVGEVR